MSGVHATHSASLLARIIYAVFAAIMPRMVRRTVALNARRPNPDRLVTLGRRTNALARGQRWRPHFGIRFSRGHGAGVPVEIVRTKDCTAPFRDGVILYFHGGGFFTGGLDTHLHVVVKLARRTGLPVVHVDYRQFPEVTVDGSIADCLGVYRWLLDQDADPAMTVLAGDSAGGFLTFATALAAPQHGLPGPAGVVGISALLELDDTVHAGHENLNRDAFGVGLGLADILDLACPSPAMRADLSPINGALDTMPPTLLIAAESEILRYDAERLYAALQRAGRPCDLQIWESQLHGFPALLPFLPESRAAYDMIIDFIAERLADTGLAGESRREVS